MTLEAWLAQVPERVVLPPTELRSSDTVLSLVTEAMNLVRQDLVQARHYGQLSKKLATWLNDSESMGRAERMLGHVELLGGKSRQANRRYERAYAWFKDNPTEQANTAVAMVQSLAYVGDYDRAFAIGQRAIETYLEHGDPFRAARIRANLGNVLHRLDRFEEARILYEDALPVLAEHKAEADLAIVMRNYGVCLMGLLDFQAADAMYRQARTVFEESGQTLLLHEIDLNRAYLLGRIGNIREALNEYRRLRDTLPTDVNYEIGHCLLDEADFMVEVGLWTDAYLAAQRAAHVFELLQSRFEMGKANLFMGIAALRRGQAREARQLLATAKKFLRKEPNRNWHALLHQTTAYDLTNQNKHAQAKHAAELALQCPPSPERLPEVRRLWTRLAIRLGDHEACLPMLEEVQDPALWTEWYLHRGESQSAENQAKKFLEDYDLQRLKLGSVGLRRSVAAAMRESLVSCHRALNNPLERLGVVVRLKDQSLADAIGTTRRGENLEGRQPGLQGDAASVRQMRENQRLLGTSTTDWQVPIETPNERFVELFDLEGQIWVYTIENGIVNELRLCPTSEIQTLADYFHLNRGRITDGGQRLAERVLVQLGEILAPVLQESPHTICVGRDGPFMGLPIHAATWQGKPLMDSIDVHYYPSASVWAQLRLRPATPSGQPLVFGVADTIAPAIEREVNDVARALAVRPSPTAEAFLKELPRASHIHLAAHGFVREDLPLLSGMQLGDTILTALDILQTPLRANLVVMSGCSTGVSQTGESRDSQGFIESLLAAGCGSVIASLWDAHDEFAAAWMYQFYACLGTDGPAKAYSKASQSVRKEWSHPGIWSAFSFFGPNSAIPVSKGYPAVH